MKKPPQRHLFLKGTSYSFPCRNGSRTERFVKKSIAWGALTEAQQTLGSESLTWTIFLTDINLRLSWLITIMTRSQYKGKYLCKGVPKNMTLYWIKQNLIQKYHVKGEIHSFLMMYNTWGSSFGWNDSINGCFFRCGKIWSRICVHVIYKTQFKCLV